MPDRERACKKVGPSVAIPDETDLGDNHRTCQSYPFRLDFFLDAKVFRISLHMQHARAAALPA